MNDIRLKIETLEDRTVPSAVSGMWANPEAVTLSFAPDGTQVGTLVSTLNTEFSSIGDPSVWQREILRAFQTWAVETNINIGLVSDDGSAFGAAGDLQGDPRFGDIRIGNTKLDWQSVASAAPLQTEIGTWGGDVLFNNKIDFAINPKNTNQYDLFTVALHEAAHAFGIGHERDTTNTVMTEAYRGLLAGLSETDILAIRQIYGARRVDAFEGAFGNETRQTATALSQSQTQGTVGDLTTRTDVDFYSFVVPSGSSGFTLKFKTGGISLLTATVKIYNANGKEVASQIDLDPLTGQMDLRINKASAGQRFFVRISASTSDVFAIGAYQFSVNFDGITASIISPYQIDGGTDDSLTTASSVTTHTPTEAVYGNQYSFSGRIESNSDVDFLKLSTPSTLPPNSDLFVRISSMTLGAEVPKVQFIDSLGNAIVSEIVESDGSGATFKLSVTAGNVYFARLSMSGTLATDYLFSANVNSPKHTDFKQLVSTVLQGSTNGESGMMVVTETKVFEFVLSGSNTLAPNTSITLTIKDAYGRVIWSLETTANNLSKTGTILLGPGIYRFEINAKSANGSTLSATSISLLGGTYGDKIGPYETKTTEDISTGGTATWDFTWVSTVVESWGLGYFF